MTMELKLKSALYGLSQSPSQWFDEIGQLSIEIGLKTRAITLRISGVAMSNILGEFRAR